MSRSAPRQSSQRVRFGVIPAHGPHHFDEALTQVKLCIEYGVDSIWIEEHHDAGPYWPTPMLAIAALAPHLGQLRIGTGILVLPLHDPVHVAEQAAVIDILTGGRFILGLGLGDTKNEFAAFQVPARRGARFEEQIAIMKALWSGERLTFNGRFYSLEDVQLATLPQQPGGAADLDRRVGTAAAASRLCSRNRMATRPSRTTRRGRPTVKRCTTRSSGSVARILSLGLGL